MGHILDELSRHPSAPPAGSQPQGSQPLGPATVPDHTHPYPQPSGTDLASLVRLLQTQPGWVQAVMQASRLLGYAQTTSTQGGITTQTALTGLSVAVTVNPAGRRIRVSCYVVLASSVNSDAAEVEIMEGATQLQGGTADLDANVGHHPFSPSVILTPSAGTHTYHLEARRVSGTGTLNTDASSTVPLYILVEDIG